MRVERARAFLLQDNPTTFSNPFLKSFPSFLFGFNENAALASVGQRH